MYLPTFWKLIQERRFNDLRRGAGWAIPAVFVCNIKNLIIGGWVGYYSIYNWIYSDVFPPEKGNLNI